MKRSVISGLAVTGLIALLFSLPAIANDANYLSPADLTSVSTTWSELNIPTARPRMSPELALEACQANSERQAQTLGEYQDTTVIQAELPKMQRKGTFRLHRMWSAPKNLAFKTIDFAGDGFVKTQVIARLLQSEVDRSKKVSDQSTAITAANYKFSYKGVEEIEGQPVHVFQVKPRHKRVGLFKGKIYVDVYNGALRRAEGKMVKSPSFFVKNIEFVQDYAQVGGFNMVTHLHSTADAKIVGKTVVDITHTDYQARSFADLQSAPAYSQPTVVRTVSYPAGSYR